jgi:hypothetical protein
MSHQPFLTLAERRAWAMRRGHPLWLWPEVGPGDWREAMLQIEAACASMLAGQIARRLSGDPAAIELAGYTSGMGPMLGWWLDGGLLRTDSRAEASLRNQLQVNRARMRNLLEKADGVARLLTPSGIKVVMLKGIHTALDYFPDPACRPMSDIDILLAADDAARAEAKLHAAGYRQLGRTSLESTWRHCKVAAEPRTFTSLAADDPWTVDLHRSLDVPGPHGAIAARLSELDPIENCSIPGTSTCGHRLEQPILLLHLAVHAGSGFHNLTLLRLMEIALVARQDRALGNLDWDEFVAAGHATGSLAFAFPALELARRLSPGDIPLSVVERCGEEAPPRIRHLIAAMRPATAHRIDVPSLREHFAWTTGDDSLQPLPSGIRRVAPVLLAGGHGETPSRT